MVYFVQGALTGLIKIGKSTDFVGRLRTLQTGSGELLTCLAVVKKDTDDTVYHVRFHGDWVRGEWFKASQELMDFIKELPETEYTGMTCTGRPIKFRKQLVRRSAAKFRKVHPEVRARSPKTALPPPMSLEEMAASNHREISTIEPESRWIFMPAGLTPKQKLCVGIYLETRDADAAILAAYDCKDVSTAERLKYDIFSRPMILEALSIYLGSSDPEVAKFIQRAAKNERISEAQVRELEESPTSAQPA